MSESLPKAYAVSFGNGNDGVSHMWPDYIVTTNDPWKLAELAMLSYFKNEHVDWAKEHMDIDGDAEYTIYAVISDPPEDESEENDSEEDEEKTYWSDANGSWMICEVYDANEVSESSSAPKYDSLEECFHPDIIARLGKE